MPAIVLTIGCYPCLGKHGRQDMVHCAVHRKCVIGLPVPDKYVWAFGNRTAALYVVNKGPSGIVREGQHERLPCFMLDD